MEFDRIIFITNLRRKHNKGDYDKLILAMRKLSKIGSRSALATRFVASLLLFVMIISLVSPPQAKSLSGSDFQPGNIIGDSIFFNSYAMTLGQIQNFLNSKVPVCNTGYTCLKDYRQDTPSRPGEDRLCSNYTGGNNMSAAEIIFSVSLACGINPQSILVLLQKEQSLVTDTWPEAIQYRSATGFGCPDTAPCDAEYYGFFNQVYNAARIYKKYARDADQYNYRAGRNNNILFHPNSACGYSTVYIHNQATAGLYNYTPYQPNAAALANLYGTGDGCSAYGNRNFWRMFNDWFGNTQGSNLVRTPASPTYYLLTAGKRYAIPSGDILYAYGLERQRVDVVSEHYITAVTDGGALSTIFTIPGDNTVYLADGGNKFGISSGTYCTRWGLACGNSAIQKVIGTEIFDPMGQGGILREVMRHNGSYYLMEAGKKRYFPSLKALTDQGYTPSQTIPIVNWTNAIRDFGTSLPENYSFIKFASSSGIFYHGTGTNFYAVPDFQTFINWYGPSVPSYFDPYSSYNATLPTTVGTLNSLVTVGANKYLLDGGSRVDVSSAAAQWPAGMDGAAISSGVSAIPIKATATATTTFRLSNGAIYLVSSGTKRPYNSVYDFQTLNSNPAMQLSASSLPVPEGHIILAEGSAYKVSGADAIFLVGQGNNSYAFSSIKQIFDFKTNLAIPTISASSAAQFTNQGVLSSRITNASGDLFIVNNGRLHPVPSNIATDWGIPTSVYTPLSDTFLARLPSAASVPAFIANETGTIFTKGSGNKRAIGSFQTYLNLGGNSSNTLKLNQAFVDSLPNGPVLP
jgi:hypothetical protein